MNIRKLVAGFCAATLVLGFSLMHTSSAHAQTNRLLLYHKATSAHFNNGYANYKTRLKQLPFDGLVISTTAGFAAMNPQYNFTYNDVYRDTNLLTSDLFQKDTLLKNNFMLIYVNRPDDLMGSDAAWNVAFAKVRAVARRGKELGCKGIFFDDEEYTGKLWDYNDPQVCVYRSTKSLAEYQQAARRRGYQLMWSILDEWPGATVITAHGSNSADENTPEDIVDYKHGSQWLRGAFDVGMLRCVMDGYNGTYVDGGEHYRLRALSGTGSFQKSFHWRNYDMKFASMVPDSFMRNNWDTLQVGFGIYDGTWPNWTTPPFTQTPGASGTYRDCIQRALATSDSYVWCFTEMNDWFATSLPTDWNDAVRAARTARSMPNPVLSSSAQVASARTGQAAGKNGG